MQEVNRRVISGASLVVAEGLLVDIHKWIRHHPGGSKILHRVIGTGKCYYYYYYFFLYSFHLLRL